MTIPSEVESAARFIGRHSGIGWTALLINENAWQMAYDGANFRCHDVKYQAKQVMNEPNLAKKFGEAVSIIKEWKNA